METPAEYRDQAKRCRRLARLQHSPEIIEWLLALAEDYSRLARKLENAPPGSPKPEQIERLDRE